MKREKVFLRQGDICFEKVSGIPEGLVKKGTVLEITGEREGHVHRMQRIRVFGSPEQQRGVLRRVVVAFVIVAAATEMVHPDHPALEVPPGIYRVTQFREHQNPRLVD